MALMRQKIFKKMMDDRNKVVQKHSSGWRYSFKLKALMILVTVLLSTLFYVFHFSETEYYNTDTRIETGQKWDNPDLTAEFTFPVYKSQKIHLAEIEEAKENALLVFNLNVEVKELVLDRIRLKTDEYLKISKDEEQVVSTDIPTEIISNLKSLDKSKRISIINNIKSEALRFTKEVYDNGFANVSVNNINNKLIRVKVANNEFSVIKTSELYDRNAVIEHYQQYILPAFSENIRSAVEYVLSEISIPNLIYNDELSQESKEIAASQVPKTLRILRAGSKIISRGEEISEESKAAILSYLSAANRKNENVYTIMTFIGSFGHAALIITILMLYLIVLRKKIFHDNAQMLIICLIILLSALISWLTIELGTAYSLEYLAIIPSLVMLAAIVFDSRTAFYVTITLSLMLAGIRGSDYVIGTTMIFAGILAAYTVRDIQNRTQMFQSIFFIFIGLTLPILIFGAERSVDSSIVMQRVLLALINSVASPLITFGLLFLIEKISDTTTDLQLKEYDNLNHSLLQKMSEIAPGTYQHTLAVAMLAERCAGAIDANPLLTKVGAYFHDIGKMAKAEYFTENQVSIDNKHEQITPKKSVQIIKEHVTDGIVLANKYKLPPRIIDFIPMHHGTTLIKHFYAKALENKGTDEEINEDDFRYPGPKPNSKETAILMICDASEAISRIADKSIEEIEEIIEENIQNRILDGQFDDCNITLQELNKIKGVLARNLIGVSHQRTSYKEIPKDKTK